MNYHLISTIVRGIWAIDQEAALGYAPLLNNIFGNSPVAFEFDDDQFKPFSVERSISTYSFTGWNDAPKGSIAIIPLSGPLMKNDQHCGPRGMASIGSLIKEADNSSNIDGIILKIDSPGGTVDGTAALAEIVKDTQKPIIAFADGLMASAALWIGASADEIIAADNKTQIGSIGVLLSFADLQPAYEKLGVKFHSITADQSTDKIKRWEELRAGNYDNYKKEVLNPLAEDFINHIKNSRPGIKADQLTGKVFFAQDVVGSLTNFIGNFDYALNRMNELIDMNKNSNTNTKPQKQMKQFEAVNKALGVAELASTDEGAYLNEEQLSTLDALLAENAQNDAALQTAQDDLKQAQDDLIAANATIQSQETEMEDLRKNPGAESAKVISEKETASGTETKDDNVVAEKNSFVENMNAVADEFGV